MKQFSIFQLPAIIWASAIFIQSSFSSISPPPIAGHYSDKVAHAVVFAILGYLTTRAFLNSSSRKLADRAILWSVIACVLYGISDEIHQYFVPGRYTDVSDFLADSVGVVVAQAPFYIQSYLRQRRKLQRQVP